MSGYDLMIPLFFWLGAFLGLSSKALSLWFIKEEWVPRCHGLSLRNLNVPIISWILFRGRCMTCKTPLGLSSLLLQIFMGLLFAAMAYKYGFSFSTLEYLWFSFAVVTASLVDLESMILPDELTLSGIGLGLLGALLNPEREFLEALLGVLGGGGFLLAVAYFYYVLRGTEGMGGGDIKLLAWIGAICGLPSIFFVIVFSSLAGLLVGVFYMFRSKEGLQTGLPFGPYLSMGAILYLIFDVSHVMHFFFPFP